MSEMVPVTRNPQDLRGQLVGRKLSFIHVHGVNSLKTLNPPPEAVVGDEIADLTIDESSRHIELSLRRHHISIDLARTGIVVVLPKAAPWSIAAGGPMPTVRLIFDDGSGIDLKEPAKTKRITLSIRTTVS